MKSYFYAVFNNNKKEIDKTPEEEKRRKTFGKKTPKNAHKDEKLASLKEIFGEPFEKRAQRIRDASPFGGLSTWKLIQVIVKHGSDLRQEQFATQLISQFDQIFKAYKIPIWVKPYEIISTGPNSGLVQCVSETLSVDSLNQKLKKYNIGSLNEFFTLYYQNKSGIFSEFNIKL